MSEGIGGISVKTFGRPIEMTEEQKRALEDVTFERIGSVAEFYALKREFEQINRDETMLEDLYKRYGDRRICELLAIIRKRRDDVEKNDTYKKFKEVELATQAFINPSCNTCPYECEGNSLICRRLRENQYESSNKR